LSEEAPFQATTKIFQDLIIAKHSFKQVGIKTEEALKGRLRCEYHKSKSISHLGI
jgi:hypothetical protein